MNTLSQTYASAWHFDMPELLKKPIVYHTLFWLVYFGFNVLRWGAYFDDYVYSLQSNTLGFSIHILLSYYSAYFLMPFFFPKKQFFQYFLALFAGVLLMTFVKISLHYYIVSPLIWRESLQPQTELFGLNHIITVMLGELYVIGITTSIKLGMDWVRSQKRTQELENQTLETELNFLKSQIQPHFFFNTLNNLYSLTLLKSDLAPEVVLKLSELMSYVLYDSRSKSISLFKEISYLQHYIDLERLRFDNRLEVNMEISGEIEGKQIPPLILLTFLENTFKHGVNLQTGDLEVNIRLSVENDSLVFEIENPLPPKQTPNPFKNGGIGLNNVRRRLELLFQKRYELDIKQEHERYKVRLKMPSP